MPNSVRFNPDYPTITASNNLYARAAGLIPAHSQTLAKGPGQYVNGVAPKYLKRGKGARVWDVDGNEYLDYNAAIGPISLGYAYPKVDEAVLQQLAEGITFSLVHPLEVEVAELIRQVVPNAEAVRYSKTGAEVTSAAVRLARAYTDRDGVLCCGYHGWHDWYIGVTSRNAGVPQVVKELVRTFPYNDLDAVREMLDENTACVILEPMVFDYPDPGFLAGLKALCRANGTLLIFDEMWTGFRWAIGGAQEFFGITPDLACFSKAIANGMPLAVLTGRAEVMALLEEEVFFFSTFGGETLSLAAARATIGEMLEQNVPAYLAHLGEQIQEGYNELAAHLGLAHVTRCIGHPARTLVTFAPSAGNPLMMKSLVQQELIKRGILWSGFHNLTFAHTPRDVDYTLAAYREALEILRRALRHGRIADQIRGIPVQPVFRQTGNFPEKLENGVNGQVIR